MNVEMWQELHDGIEDYDGNSSAWDGFNAALEAMRQPITAEELWKLGFIPETAKYGGEQFVRDIDANTRIVVGFWNDEPTVKIVHMERDVLTPGVTTMYQLGQLVELLGGSQ